MPTLSAVRKRATLELVASFLDKMTDALDHIDDEMRYTSANVFPAQTSLAASSYTNDKGQIVTVGSSGGGRGPATSPVERRVIDAQDRLRSHEKNLWDAFNAICEIAHDGAHQATAASNRLVPAHEHVRCTSGTESKSLEGWAIWRYKAPLTQPDGTIVYRDAECVNWPGTNPVIAGMCDDCLDRMNDWRTTNGYERIVRDTQALNYLGVRGLTQGKGGRFTAA